MLENAALEEDPDLAAMWANLLANAAAKGEQVVRPLFVTMLKELTSEEAKHLKTIHYECHEKRRNNVRPLRIAAM